MVEQGIHKPLVGSPNLPLGTHDLHTLSSGFIWLNVRSVCIIIKGLKEMALDRFITLSEAAQRMRTSVKETRSMIKSGKIKGGLLSDGAMVVSEDTIPKRKEKRKEDLPEYKKYAHLKGVGIGMGEASRKYNIPTPTISHWTKRKLIKIIKKEGQKIYIDEQNVAYCASIYNERKGQGKWLFNNDGTPFIPNNGSSAKKKD